MREVKLITIDPQEFQNEIIRALKSEFSLIKDDLKIKEQDNLLSRIEVSKLLKCDISTVHNYTKKGKLKAYGIGNRVLYKRSEVESSLTPLN